MTMRDRVRQHWLIYSLLTIGSIVSLALGFVIDGTGGLIWAGGIIGVVVGGMIASLTRDAR